MRNMIITALAITALLSVAFIGHVMRNQQTINIAVVGIVIYGAWLVFASLPLAVSHDDRQ